MGRRDEEDKNKVRRRKVTSSNSNSSNSSSSSNNTSRRISSKPKKRRKSNKGKIIGGFLGAIVLIGVIGFALVKFDFIDLDILDGIFNKGDDLSKEVYCKEVSEENVKYDDGILYANNQVSLIANEGVKKREIKKLAKQYGAEIVGYIEFTGDYQLEFSEEKSYDELNSIVSELQLEPNVESASLYRVDKVNTDEFYPSNDDYGGASWDQSNPEGNNWGVEAIQAPSAWNLRDEMSEVKIGLVDTNVDSDHEDLQFKKVWNSEYENVAFEHGTHVAGIMGAKFDGNKSNTQTGVTGVCPKPILYAASSLGYGEYVGYMSIKCSLSRLILSGVKVINCSLGYNELQIAATVDSQNQKVKDKLDYLNKDMTSFLNKFIDEGYDFLIVASAGNNNGYYYKKVKESDEHEYGIEISSEKKWGFKKCENIDAGNDILSNITDEDLKSRIILVGADVQYENGYALSYFSSTGSRVDVLAPGENVYSTLPNNNYGALAGTSMASPYVSGLAGMIYGINNNLSASQVKEIIINTATTDVRNTDKKMINSRMAVNLAKEYKGEGKDAYNQKGAFLCSVIDKQEYKSKEKSTLEEASMAAEKSALEGVEVTLKNGDNVYVLKTNELGEIDYLVEPGTYNIEFKKEGYQSGILENVEIGSKDIVYKKVFMDKSQSEKYDEYIRNILIPKYGIADLSKVNINGSSFDKILLSNGISDISFRDLNADSQKEMIVTIKTADYGSVKSDQYEIEIYTISNDKVVKLNDSIEPIFVLAWGTEYKNENLNIFTKNYEGQEFLFTEHYSTGTGSEESGTTLRIYKMIGDKVVLQREFDIGVYLSYSDVNGGTDYGHMSYTESIPKEPKYEFLSPLDKDFSDEDHYYNCNSEIESARIDFDNKLSNRMSNFGLSGLWKNYMQNQNSAYNTSNQYYIFSMMKQASLRQSGTNDLFRMEYMPNSRSSGTISFYNYNGDYLAKFR